MSDRDRHERTHDPLDPGRGLARARDLDRNPRNPHSPMKESTMGKMFLFFLFAATIVLAAAEIARMLP